MSITDNTTPGGWGTYVPSYPQGDSFTLNVIGPVNSVVYVNGAAQGSTDQNGGFSMGGTFDSSGSLQDFVTVGSTHAAPYPLAFWVTASQPTPCEGVATDSSFGEGMVSTDYLYGSFWMETTFNPDPEAVDLLASGGSGLTDQCAPAPGSAEWSSYQQPTSFGVVSNPQNGDINFGVIDTGPNGNGNDDDNWRDSENIRYPLPYPLFDYAWFTGVFEDQINRNGDLFVGFTLTLWVDWEPYW